MFVLVAGLMAVALAGCSEEEREKVSPLRPLQVKEQASSVLKGEGGYVVNWAGVLGNANPWHFGEHVVATIVAKDAKGAEVVRMDQPLDAVPPHGTLAFSGKAVAKVKPETVSITYSQAKWNQAGRIPSAFQPFPVTDVVTKRQKNGGYLISGRVGTPYERVAGTLAVTALLRDAAGKLLGGASTFVDDVRSDAKQRFIVALDSVPKGVAKADVIARTWGSTSRPYEELAMGGTVPVHTVKPKTPPFAKDRGRTLIPGVDTRPE
ncbi:hypothetical protein GCM10023259_098380 [Thermocatellispora tengchongensis]